MPEEDLDAVIGVDTHRDTHMAALVDTVGRQLAVLSSAQTRPATPAACLGGRASARQPSALGDRRNP